MTELDALRMSIRRPHLPDKMAAFAISDTKRRKLVALFATHRDLDDRIRALETTVYPENLLHGRT